VPVALQSVSLAARLRLSGRYGEREFTLADLPAALLAAAPDRLGLTFEVSASGAPALELEATFAVASADSRLAPAERAHRLQEYLVRADIAGHLDYEARAVPESSTAAAAGLGLALPDDLALPSGPWLALPLPLLEVAADLLCHAQAAGRALAYRVELAPRSADPAAARSLVPAVAALATRGRQPALQECLSDAMTLLVEDGWTARERLLSASPGDALAWLGPLATRRIRAAWPYLPDGLLALAPLAAQTGNETSRGVAIQGARAAAYLDDVLGRLLPSHPATPFVPAPTATPADAGSYVFLSYAHADRAFALQVVERLAQAGLKVWYDTGIEPGTAWDDTLEQRIRGACAVVACVSSSFEQSRWCTRELKFADLLGKTIVPVAARPWTWGEGLQLMFQSLQVCSFDHGRGTPSLLAMLRAHAAAAFDDETCPERSGDSAVTTKATLTSPTAQA
jgi:hypothetical protein